MMQSCHKFDDVSSASLVARPFNNFVNKSKIHFPNKTFNFDVFYCVSTAGV